MNKVYVVTSGEYSDYGINRIFDTKEHAEKYTGGRFDYSIEEWDLEGEPELILRQAWRCSYLVNGSKWTGSQYVEISEKDWLVNDPYPILDEAPPTMRTKPRDFFYGEKRDTLIVCKSYISSEHAKKLAVEAMQEFRVLRSQGHSIESAFKLMGMADK